MNEFDIIEHPSILLWLKEYAKNDPLGFCFLIQGNLEHFKKIWGNPNGQSQRFSYWKREHLGIVIYVYSDTRSTFYKTQYLGDKETFVQDKKMGAYLHGFLNKISREMVTA